MGAPFGGEKCVYRPEGLRWAYRFYWKAGEKASGPAWRRAETIAEYYERRGRGVQISLRTAQPSGPESQALLLRLVRLLLQ